MKLNLFLWKCLLMSRWLVWHLCYSTVSEYPGRALLAVATFVKIFWDTIAWKKFNIPIVIPSSLRLTRPPLLFGMDISAMYIHSAIADNETANPKISRPNRTDARFWDKATTNAPIVKRSALRIIVVLRPNRSTNIPLKMQISN